MTPYIIFTCLLVIFLLFTLYEIKNLSQIAYDLQQEKESLLRINDFHMEELTMVKYKLRDTIEELEQCKFYQQQATTKTVAQAKPVQAKKKNAKTKKPVAVKETTTVNQSTDNNLTDIQTFLNYNAMATILSSTDSSSNHSCDSSSSSYSSSDSSSSYSSSDSSSCSGSYD